MSSAILLNGPQVVSTSGGGCLDEASRRSGRAVQEGEQETKSRKVLEYRRDLEEELNLS